MPGWLLSLAPIGKWLLRAFKGALKWALEHPWQIACAVFLVLWLMTRGDLFDERKTSATLRDRVAAEVANHRQTKEVYARAQAEAARLDQQRLARVKADQQEITDDVVAGLNRRLADMRAYAERLRLAAAGAGAAGAPGAVDVPGAGDAAGRADQAAGDRGLPLAPAGLSSREIAWRLTATEQAIQLDELINWTLRQAGVEVNDQGATK